MAKQTITLEEVKSMTEEMLSPAIVAQVIGCSQYYISLQARTDPSKLGSPVCVMGKRTRIPRRAFIRFMEG